MIDPCASQCAPKPKPKALTRSYCYMVRILGIFTLHSYVTACRYAAYPVKSRKKAVQSQSQFFEACMKKGFHLAEKIEVNVRLVLGWFLRSRVGPYSTPLCQWNIDNDPSHSSLSCNFDAVLSIRNACEHKRKGQKQFNGGQRFRCKVPYSCPFKNFECTV